MKYTLIVMILTISFTSVARGVDQTNPTDRSVKIDWVKHPGAKKVIAGVTSIWGHCKDNMKIVPTGDFSDTNGDNWKETGVNSGDESIWSINSVFSYINVDAGKIGNNTVTCNLTVKDGTKFTATYDFETVKQKNIVAGPERITKENKRFAFAGNTVDSGSAQNFTLDASATITNEWKETNSDTSTVNGSVGLDSSGKQIGTVSNIGQTLIKSFTWLVGVALNLNYKKEIEDATSKSLSGSNNVSAKNPLTVSVAPGKQAIVYTWTIVRNNTVTATTYMDANGDGFPEGEPDVSTGVVRNIAQTFYELTAGTIDTTPAVP